MRPSHCAGWKFHCLFFLLLLIEFSTVAQPPQRPAPETLPELLGAIEDVMKRERIPGLMLSIVTKDSVLFSGGLGYSDLAAQRKTDGQQKFRLGSTTKMMVAMGILHLVHHGKLSLNAKLKDIAPEVPFENRWEQTHPVRVMNLLEHTTGFQDAFMNKTINTGTTDRKGLDVLKFYADQLNCSVKPGTTPSYSNTNYTVLGYLIEKISGQEWAEYLKQHVLTPIGMHHTDFALRLPQNGEYAQGYYTRGAIQVPVPSAFTLNSNGAHGSMNSCADDMTLLLRFFLNHWRMDTTAWLPESYLTDMETVHTTLAAQHGLKRGYGMGNHIETWHPKCTFYGHGGTIQGFVAHMIYDRKRGIGMAIAKNGGYNDARIAMLVTDFLTRKLPVIEAVEKNIPTDSIQPYLGYYSPQGASSRYGFLEDLVNDVAVKQEGNRLVLAHLSGRPTALTHVGKLVFRRSFEHDAQYVLGHDDDGNKILMSASPRGGTNLVKSSAVRVFLKRCFAIGGLLALVLSIFVGVISVMLAVFKRISAVSLPLMVLPMLATLSLTFGLRPLVLWDSNYLSFTEPNGVTLTVFFGTLLFGVLSTAGLWFLYARWKSLKHAWAKAIITFTVVGTFTVAGLFLIHGMIGTMIWNW